MVGYACTKRCLLPAWFDLHVLKDARNFEFYVRRRFSIEVQVELPENGILDTMPRDQR